MTLFLILGCSLSGTVQTFPVTVQGAIFGGDGADSVPLDLEFDTKWITSTNNKVYNSKLASFSAVLCDDIYFRSKDLAKGTANRVLINGEEESYSQTGLLEELGYTDVRFVESFKQKSYDADTNDSVTMLMAYKNTGKYDSFIFVFRGCFSAGERLSIFDVGSETDDYTKLTGAHAEWKNKSVLKGLDIATERAMEFISEYIDAHDVPENKNTALVTGHSRGASLANVIGAKFEKDESIKSYTYTFNTMAFTTDSDAPSYDTVFNIFDENDYYTDPIPFGSEKMYRYGRDIGVNITDSSKIKGKIADLKGRDDYVSLSAEKKAGYDKLFGEAFPDRASLYRMKTRTAVFESGDEMTEAAESIRSNASALGMDTFVTVSENPDGKSLTVTYCGAALLAAFAQIQCYGEAAYTAVIAIFDGDATYCELAQFVFETLAETTGGHLLINSYILAKQTKFAL